MWWQYKHERVAYQSMKDRAILRSVIETCKIDGISIVKYFIAIVDGGCSSRIDFEKLLPLAFRPAPQS
ncbi:MAG: hypothetical protein HDQ88_01100 [Clostridia bacterium]|nr:hypothetical protein [Clostridia bacterium]